MIKKTIIFLIITCFVMQSTGMSRLSGIAIVKPDALRPMATTVQTEEQKATYYMIAPSIPKASGLPKPQKQTLSDFGDKISPLHKDVKNRLIAITLAIEAALGISKYIGLAPFIVGLFTGYPLSGSIVGGIIFLSTGICRLFTFIVFKYKYPGIPIPKSFYIMTLLPFGIGFAYTLAYLYFPDYGFRDTKRLKDIVYKIESVFYRSAFQKNSPIDFELLIKNKYFIADDILRYQKSHFGLFDSKYRKFFRIRSARWTTKQESRMYTHLHRKKRFLFADLWRLIERLAVIFKEQYGHSHLKRIYYYDVWEFLTDISKVPAESSPSEKRKRLKKTYIKHLFPEYGISGAQLDGIDLQVEDVEMAILQRLHDNSDRAFTIATIKEDLKFDINDENLRRIIEDLCEEGLVKETYLQHKPPQSNIIFFESGTEDNDTMDTMGTVLKGTPFSTNFIQNSAILTTIASAA